MKKLSLVLLICALTMTLLAGCGQPATPPAPPSDQAILVVSFGTSYNDSREKTIGAIEKAIATAFPDYGVRRAFTSQTIIDKLEKRDHLVIDNVEQALERAVTDGVKTLIVQPTHLMNGNEYNDLAAALQGYQGKFEHLTLAEPLLTSDADCTAVINAVTAETASYDDGKTAICFMGHGTSADSNAIYGKLQAQFTAEGHSNYYVGTVEAAPTLADLMTAVKAGGYAKVVLEPLMVVAGDHANNDMAGDEPDSWKSQFEAAGYQVETVLRGLGEFPGIRAIYVAHTQAAIAGLAAGTVAAPAVAPAVEKPLPPIAGTELKDGTYPIDVTSSSSMFKVVDAQLTAKGGELSAVLTLSGTGYLRLYSGTGETAATASATAFYDYVENADGQYTYTVPVSALNEELPFAAYSIKKETWYDRTLVFLADSLPAEAFVTAPTKKSAAPDGKYTIDVTLTGGSGKAKIASPAPLTIADGQMTATLAWNSPNYDYMVVDGQKYLPTNTEGNSVFSIPVSALDCDLAVTADTTAMSKPHEIAYTLHFAAATLQPRI